MVIGFFFLQPELLLEFPIIHIYAHWLCISEDEWLAMAIQFDGETVSPTTDDCFILNQIYRFNTNGSFLICVCFFFNKFVYRFGGGGGKQCEMKICKIHYLVRTTTVSRFPATPMITTHGTRTLWKQYLKAANVSSSIIRFRIGEMGDGVRIWLKWRYYIIWIYKFFLKIHF